MLYLMESLTFRRARSTLPSDLRHFLIIGFRYLIWRSMNPFDCEYLGLVVVWSIPHYAQNILYIPWYCSPLSDTISLGTPNILRISIVAVTTAADVMDFSSLMIG